MTDQSSTGAQRQQSLNSGPLLRREDFPNLTDEQWRERRSTLWHYARERESEPITVTFAGSVVDFHKPPQFRWKTTR